MDINSDYEEELEQTIDDATNSTTNVVTPMLKIPPLTIKTRRDGSITNKEITITAKEKLRPATMLTDAEKKIMAKKIKEYTADLHKQVEE